MDAVGYWSILYLRMVLGFAIHQGGVCITHVTNKNKIKGDKHRQAGGEGNDLGDGVL